jgi:hypothetical protein
MAGMHLRLAVAQLRASHPPNIIMRESEILHIKWEVQRISPCCEASCLQHDVAPRRKDPPVIRHSCEQSGNSITPLRSRTRPGVRICKQPLPGNLLPGNQYQYRLQAILADDLWTSKSIRSSIGEENFIRKTHLERRWRTRIGQTAGGMYRSCSTTGSSYPGAASSDQHVWADCMSSTH